MNDPRKGRWLTLSPARKMVLEILHHGRKVPALPLSKVMQVGDLAPTFANLYPEILDPLVSEEEFRRVIKHVNRELIAAFSPWSARAWCDAALGVATLWLWEDVGLTGVKSRLKKLEAWIEAWNRDVGSEESVKIIPLRRTAYMTVSLIGFVSGPFC